MITNLITDRLCLRKMETNDAASLFNIWSDPEVTKFMNITSFTDESQAQDMIHFLNKLYEDNKAIRYTIIELATNQIIGSCGFNSLDQENEKAEIGYELAKESWGKGYATEAISKLLTVGFDSFNLNRIEAKIEPDNHNSIKLVEKLRFTLEGTLRQYEKYDERYIDLHLYSKLKSDSM
ncbi:GNAT family N-acetyltransferase [Agaribacter marinus]|uniref:GNAT family N-acetyltransferase n=1 Tax=Virgibacillus salarius TaxID=447199 RepID=A0A941ICR0_9BACI|nr:GNAT family protein [Virgibacillus salarius]MBR7796410.1 GNAT family N-acetyltransferase [Virgibacillus salarius]NAZ09119.1 GNAT family N-acetyltransferase [Agaribacter marinus]WBX80603.1 GNAT family protein [Virgibacillus salarius]